MLSIDDIIERLQEEFQKIYPYGYEVDRRTVKTDIERLNKINFYIEELTVKYGKKLYYYVGEVFEMYEIRILLFNCISPEFYIIYYTIWYNRH